MNSILLIINSISALNAIILSAILFFRRNNVLPNYMLSGIMVIPGLYFINSIFLLEKNAIPWLFYVVQFCAIFFIPFYSVYVYSLLGKPISRLRFIFFISALIGLIPCYLCYKYFYNNNSALQENLFIQLINGPYPSEITFYSLIFYLFQQVVFIFLLVEIIRVKKILVAFYADIDQSKIVYLRNLTVLLILLNFSILLLYIVFDVLIVEYALLPIIITLIYIYIVYYAFKNYGIFTKEGFQTHLNHIGTIAVETKAVLQEDSTLQFRQEIDEILINQNLISDPHLTLKKLSQAMNRPMSEVSKLIHIEFGRNFYGVINSRRIEKAKKMLEQKNDFTIEGIGYEVGFNSKAAFYRAFKKYTKTTPTNYMSNKYN